MYENMAFTEELERYEETVQENFVDAFPYVREYLEDTENDEITPGDVLLEANAAVGRKKVEQTLFVMEREGSLDTRDYTFYTLPEDLDIDSWQETYEELRSRQDKPEKLRSPDRNDKSLDEIADEYFG